MTTLVGNYVICTHLYDIKKNIDFPLFKTYTLY